MPTAFDNLDLGPCYVSFKGTDLGLTKGGVEVEFSTDTQTVTADQFGDTVINEFIKSRAVMVKVPLAESDLTKLAAVFPATTLVGTGAVKKLVFKDGIGTSLRALAGALVLHPKGMAENDKSKDFNVPSAMAKGDMSFAFKHDDQRVYMLEFKGYVDLETGELFTMGDPAAAA